jgi:hypothetical protein
MCPPCQRRSNLDPFFGQSFLGDIAGSIGSFVGGAAYALAGGIITYGAGLDLAEGTFATSIFGFAGVVTAGFFGLGLVAGLAGAAYYGYEASQ